MCPDDSSANWNNPRGNDRDVRGIPYKMKCLGFENEDQLYSFSPSKRVEVHGWVGHRKS
jgi:hypothetical protein